MNFQQTEHQDPANTSVRLCSCTKPRVCINSCTGTTSSLSKQREFNKSICSPPLIPSSLEQSGPGARLGLRSASGNKLTRRRLRMTLDYFSEILRMSREPPSYPCLGGGFQSLFEERPHLKCDSAERINASDIGKSQILAIF